MQKLETKFARYELRTKKHEVQVVSAHWLILASAVGSVFVLKQRLHNKYVGAMQELRRRADKVLGRLLVLCIALGKFKVTLCVVRARRSKFVSR